MYSAQCRPWEESAMSKVWHTKYGSRRVRVEPPTLDEAVFAARGLTDDPNEQAEIAASLMGMPVEKVKVAVLKASQRKDVNRVTFTKRGNTERAVVVERKVTRRFGARPGSYRPLG
jgi:hypothetical protein